jgi:hypothetical protein
MPYEALAQQRYPRAYPSSQPTYPSYAVDARQFLGMSQLHHQQQQQQQQHHQQQQHQHHMAMMGQDDPSRGPPRQNEPKPRLAKDEVELLEREFAKNPKPNSSTKRDLAERMAVDVARINVSLPRCRSTGDAMTTDSRTIELVPEQTSQGQAPGQGTASPRQRACWGI